MVIDAMHVLLLKAKPLREGLSHFIGQAKLTYHLTVCGYILAPVQLQ